MSRWLDEEKLHQAEFRANYGLDRTAFPELNEWWRYLSARYRWLRV